MNDVELGRSLEAAARLRRSGDAEGAHGILCDALQQRVLDRGGGSGDIRALRAVDLALYDQLADSAVLCGSVDAARDLLRASCLHAERNGDAYAADYAALRAVRLATHQGDLAAADALLADPQRRFGDPAPLRAGGRDFAAWERVGSWPSCDREAERLLWASYYLSVGEACVARGEYAAAGACFERGLFHARVATSVVARDHAPLLELGRARALLEGGDLVTSRQRLQALRRGPPLAALHRLELCELGSQLALLTGSYGMALAELLEADALCDQEGLEVARMTVRVNLAHTLTAFNDTAEAEELLLSVASRLDPVEHATLQRRVEFVLKVCRLRRSSTIDEILVGAPVTRMWADREPADSAAHDPASAELSLVVPAARSHLGHFEDQCVLFQHLLGARQGDKAAAQLEQIETRYGHSESRIVQARLLALKGTCAYYLRRDPVEAERWLAASSRALDELGAVPALREVRRLLASVWRTRGRSNDEIERALQIGALTDRLAASLPMERRGTYLLNKWSDADRALGVELTRLVGHARRVRSRSWLSWFRRRRLESGLRYFLRLVERARHAEVRQHRERRPRRLVRGWFERLLGSGERGHATIVFVALPDQIVIVLRRGRRLSFGVGRMTRVRLRELVARWHRCAGWVGEARGLSAVSLMDRVVRAQRELKEVERELAQGLQLPALTELLGEHVRSLTIVPDDVLHGFPFACVDELAGHALTIGFASVEPHRWCVTLGSGVVVGVSGAPPGLPALSHAAPEAQAVSEELLRLGLARDRLHLLRGDVDKGELTALMPAAAILHIACHGRFSAEAPADTGLIVSPGAGPHGLLSLPELQTMNLANLEHVTLSSCWSADNYVLPGRKLYSLPQAFWCAGARSILACLWPVHDGLASAFMRRFYALLGRLPSDQALQTLQAECRSGELRRFALPGEIPDALDITAPVFWGGFCLYGAALSVDASATA